jgi:hypothetical protein
MTDIVIGDVTEGATSVTGIGAFDELMKASAAHLHLEYHKNRIKGTDYSTVYLGAMTNTMQQAVQFILQEQVADKQADLIEEQIQSAKIDLLLKAQALRKGEIEIKTMTKQLELLDKQIDKITAESLLLDQKLITETAQTVGEVQIDINGIPESVTVGGAVGRQLELYTMQKLGFQRDAEQKASKIWADSWSVRRSTDDGYPADGSGLEDINIQEALRLLMEGVQGNFVPVTPIPI